MRAKFAVALAAFGLLAFSLPSIAMHDTLYEVSRILYGDGTIVLNRAAVVAPATGCAPAGPLTVNDNPYVIREIPAVLAPTSAGVAIITEIPSDLDIRREDLGRKIDIAMCNGGLPGGQGAMLKSALAQVGCAEVSMRSDGLLSNRESRRLYKAMDKIGSDLDYWAFDDNRFLGFRF